MLDDIDSPFAIDLPEAATPRLSLEHEALILASGISQEIAQERCYQTVSSPALLRQVGFSKKQSENVPGLLFPQHSPLGEVSYQIRPDAPRLDKDGKPRKYETRYGHPLVLDVHPRMARYMLDPEVALWITEGMRKGDALASRGHCAISLSGVDCWRSRVKGKSEPLPDWDEVELEGRLVVLCFDSDARSNSNVLRALKALKKFLVSEGAVVQVVLPPPAADGGKQGIDDYLTLGGSLDSLFVGDLDVPARVQVGDEQADALYGEMLALLSAEQAQRLHTPPQTYLDTVRTTLGPSCWKKLGISVVDPSNGEIVHDKGGWCRKGDCPRCLDKDLRDVVLPGLALAFAGRDLWGGWVDPEEWRQPKRGVKRWLQKHCPRDYFYNRYGGHLVAPEAFTDSEQIPAEHVARALLYAVLAAPVKATDGRRFMFPEAVSDRRAKAKPKKREDGKIRKRFRASVEAMDGRIDARYGAHKHESEGGRSVTRIAPTLVADYLEHIVGPEDDAVADALSAYRERKEYEITPKDKALWALIHGEPVAAEPVGAWWMP